MPAACAPGAPGARLASVRATLTRRWPGRARQVDELLAVLGAAGRLGNLPVFIYGGRSTGKTCLTRDVLKELGLPHSYSSCTEFSKPRPLLVSILNQLKEKKRKVADAFCGDCRTDLLADLLSQLRAVAPASKPVRYIVLDHAQQLADQDFLAVLLRLRELTGANATVILLSCVAWGSFLFDSHTLKCPRPLQIWFPGYSRDALTKIVSLAAPEGADLHVFHRFITSIILPFFARSSVRVEELQIAAQELFAKYMEPVERGAAAVSDHARLHAMFLPSLEAARQRFEGASQASSSRAALDFQLPYMSKMLLLAAFICSRNKPSLDQRIFDASASSGRQRGTMASDRQVEAAKEGAMLGGHSFGLERLLYVFWQLLRLQGVDGSEEQSADIFTQLSSLVSLKLLAQGSCDPLADVKYTCNVTLELAEGIAANVRMSDFHSFIRYV